jgi:hypothetical protein
MGIFGSSITSDRCKAIPSMRPRLWRTCSVELRALGQSRESVVQAGACIAVEVPLARGACLPGEGGEGDDLAGAQGCLWSRVSFFVRAGLAEVVDHNVECGEEGVHINHESVPFPSGSVWASRH